ncbi:MAG: hypothetical protein N3E50_03805 [Candidatus Goldbacteria bacterium]|nr:hypothetical protein [Candidatus Goldiibacteriota bacterium]
MKRFILSFIIVLIISNFIVADFYFEITEPLDASGVKSINDFKNIKVKNNNKFSSHKKHKKNKNFNNFQLDKCFFSERYENKIKIVSNKNKLSCLKNEKYFLLKKYFKDIENTSQIPFILSTNRQLK